MGKSSSGGLLPVTSTLIVPRRVKHQTIFGYINAQYGPVQGGFGCNQVVASVRFGRRARFCYNASWPASFLALILKLCRRLNCSPRTVEGDYNSLAMRRAASKKPDHRAAGLPSALWGADAGEGGPEVDHRPLTQPATGVAVPWNIGF
jgi:hypothetical protein